MTDPTGSRVAGHVCDRVVIAVTGSIAAINVPHFVGMLRERHVVADVRIIMSDAARRFITPLTMEVMSGNAVLGDLFDPVTPYTVGHAQVLRGAGALIVMPATANVLGKAAAGIADDAVTAAILAAPCPVILVPAMNDRMWSNPIVQRNVQVLRAASHRVLTPETGLEVATGANEGRAMPSPGVIISEIVAAVHQRGEPVEIPVA